MLNRCLLLSISLFFVFNIGKASPSTDSIVSRYKQYMLRSSSLKDVDEYISKYASNLSSAKLWTDIDYADTSPSYWPTRNHLGRVKILAMGWSSPESKYYKNQQIWQTLSDALDTWLEKRYTNSNWWVNEIGVPQDMRDILVLIGSSLAPQQRKEALEVLAQHKVRGVGANLVWSADLAIHYGALTGDEAMIARSVELISKEIKVSTGEGIQPDYSYHQHESRLQIYHYGNSFLETNVRIAWEVRATAWPFPSDKINILTNFIINGWQWMSRGINIVPGTIDRAASRQDQLHNADLRHLIPYLCDLNPAYQAAFTAIADRQNGHGHALEGFRYYPYSDFAAYQQKQFSFFIKTISTRTLTSESINTENVKGRLLNNGDAYLISNGNEYFNLMPAWNWNFLPGQTNMNSSLDTIIRKLYAGSVTDGNSGLTAMDYALQGGAKNITAHKMWACYRNTIVCLVSNIDAHGSNDSLFTALDQSRWQGRVEVNSPGNVIDAKGDNQMNNVRWIHHANFGYILLQPSAVQVRLNEVTSSWSAINLSASPAPVTEKVFMPLLYHDALNNSSTGYVLVAASTAAAVKKIADKPVWKILSNNAKSQAVSFADGVVMAAFFEAGTVAVEPEQLLAVDKPCLIQITNNHVFISDPLHVGGVINFRFHNKTYSVVLKDDGTTVSAKL